MNFEEARRTVPMPGTDPVERLKHVNTIYAGDVGMDDHAITATHSLYAPGVWTGLTYGDLQELEKVITLGATAERVKIVNYLRSVGREMDEQSDGMGVGAAMAAWVSELADKISSYQDEPSAVSGKPGINAGHGHVYPRPDGVKARCMGPGGCLVCSEDKIKLLNSQKLSAS